MSLILVKVAKKDFQFVDNQQCQIIQLIVLLVYVMKCTKIMLVNITFN